MACSNIAQNSTKAILYHFCERLIYIYMYIHKLSIPGYTVGCFVGIFVGGVDGKKDTPSLGNGESESDDAIVGVSLGDSSG